MHAPARGFTLVECAITLAVVGVLAGLAWPAWNGHALRSARLDGVALLTRVQMAQESFRSHHGRYSSEIAPLAGVKPTSLQGRYVLTLELQGPERYRAIATARGVQQRDTPCPALTLEVREGFAQPGPSAACWNR